MPSQPPEPSDRRAFAYRCSVLFALGLAITAAPLFELTRGRYPGSGSEGIRSFEDLVEGTFARRVDKAIDDDSAIAETLGPRYRQLLVESFEVANRQIHFGQDDWLFLSATIENYPPAESVERLPFLIKTLATTVEAMEAHGTKVLFLLVPDKAVVAPDKAARNVDSTRIAYESALDALRSAGLKVIDPRPVLREGDVIHFRRTDTHWTPQGALRAAQAIARQAVALFPEGLPGELFHVELETGNPTEGESDLQKLLGLPRDSSTWRRYLAAWRPIMVRDPSTHHELIDRSPRDIVNGGTSFSNGSNLPGLLSATLGRRVQDLAEAGMPISYPGVSLIEDVVAGERDWPKLLIWEIPDRLLYLNPDQTRLPLEHARTLLGYDLKDSVRIEPATIEGYTETARSGGRTTYTRSSLRCFFEYHLEDPLPSDGSYAFACVVAGTPASKCTLQFDTGNGFSENRTTILLGSDRRYHVAFPLETDGGGRVRAIRFQPSITTGEVTIESPVLARRRR